MLFNHRLDGNASQPKNDGKRRSDQVDPKLLGMKQPNVIARLDNDWTTR
jgi:hypothetical protein